MESLDENLFFRVLTTTFKKRYQEIIDNCYHVCVPINGSYEPKHLNDKFISSHILKPSPLLKSHFLPYNNKQNFHVQIDGKLIKLTKGFGDSNHQIVRILYEEKAYNNANKRYSIFICEKPLISSLNCKFNYESFNVVSQDIELISFEDCERFLHDISKTELNKLNQEIKQLIKTYIILPDYLQDVAMKLKKIIDTFIMTFMREFCNKNRSLRNNKELLSSTIESYSIGLLYNRLITLINKKMSKQDEMFVRKIRKIYHSNLKPTDFGAQRAFEKFTITNTIVSKFNELESQNTPLSKLNCMRQTLDIINDQLKQTVDEHRSPFSNHTEKIYIMSDDLLAAVICVLALCQPNSFCSTIEFIHSFSWYLPQNSELGYSLVTFEVAKEYIMNYNNQDLVYNNSKSRNSIQISQDIVSHYSAKASNSLINSEFSSLDYEIDKITKIIGNSSTYSNDKQLNSEPQCNTEELGGFLSSLASSFITSSGQKC